MYWFGLVWANNRASCLSLDHISLRAYAEVYQLDCQKAIKSKIENAPCKNCWGNSWGLLGRAVHLLILSNLIARSISGPLTCRLTMVTIFYFFYSQWSCTSLKSTDHISLILNQWLKFSYVQWSLALFNFYFFKKIRKSLENYQ